MKRTIVLGLSLATLVAATGIVYYEDQHRPIPQFEYAKICLLNSKNEVKYKLGVPDHVIEDDCSKDIFGCNYRMYVVDGSDPKNKIPSEKSFYDFNRWTYDQKLAEGRETGYIEIDFDQNTKEVSEISCFAYDAMISNPFVCDVLAYSKSHKDLISVGTTEDELKDRLGGTNI